jgi:hypothetical protein
MSHPVFYNPMTKYIHPLHTACKKCVFALYHGKTQTGCDLRYLDSYRNKNSEILDVYDSELEFYVINEKKCPGYREQSWLIRNKLMDTPREDWVKVFNDQNKIGYLLVIDYRLLGDSLEVHEYLKQTLASLVIKPQKIVFVRSASGSEYTKYSNIQKLMTDTNIDCAWRIQSMVDDSIQHYDVLHSIVNLNKSYRFVCDIQKVPCFINQVIERAQTIVCEELDQFTVLTDQQYSVVIFSGGVYRFSIIENGRDILSDKENYTLI